MNSMTTEFTPAFPSAKEQPASATGYVPAEVALPFKQSLFLLFPFASALVASFSPISFPYSGRFPLFWRIFIISFSNSPPNSLRNP